MVDLQKLLDQMTIEEKIGQLAQYNANVFIRTDATITGPMTALGLTDEDVTRVGSTLNFASVAEMKQIQKTHLEQDRNKIPMLFMMDVIHGFRTIYPIPLAMGCTFNEALVERCSRMASKEAASYGVQVTFTPMVDYARDARWGRVMETCGEEPLINSRMGAAQVRAFQGDDLSDPESLATCVKHFAAYGGAEAGRDYNTVDIAERTLREFYLPAYKACIDAGTTMLMPSFNSLNGVPSVANAWLMKKILKEEWGFEGVVISDYNAIGELRSHGVAGSRKEAGRMAFENGCDIEMCSSAYCHHLKELVEEGVFTQQQIDEAVMRVLKLKEHLGLFEDPYHGASEEKGAALFLCPEHRAIAKEAALEAAVLLKNNGVLPFKKTVRKIALIGPLADSHKLNGWWSCNGRKEESTTIAQGVQALLPDAEVTVVRGCGNLWDDTDTTGFAEAVAAAQNADAVILCLGEPDDYSGEGNSRADIGLPGMQVQLAQAVAAVNPNTAAVLINGRPLALTELDAAVPAILEMWFPGTEGGNAAAELLFGDANPSGKLTMTFPRAVGQCPIYYNRNNTGRPTWKETPARGYNISRYIGLPTMPLYYFGQGLSYTKFTYGELKLSSDTLTADGTLTASITVRNDGDMAGKETVQLYMRDMIASVVRPVQQLIAYEKITLAPGEEKTVIFSVTEEMLRFWNADMQHVSEPGDFKLMVGYADHFVSEKTFNLE